MTQTRWKQRPPGSTWGDFGPDDELGRLNLVTPEKVLQGIAEVKVGKSFCLSLPLDYPKVRLSPRRPPPELRPTVRAGGLPNMNYPMQRDDPVATDVISDDQAVLTLQYSTHWDSLAHVGQLFDADQDGHDEPCYYNGFRAGEDVTGPLIYSGAETRPQQDPAGAERLSVAGMAETCIQGRGVMIDLEAHFGQAGTLVDYAKLQHVLSTDHVVVEPGDIICLRTGFSHQVLVTGKQCDMPALLATASGLDGRDPELQDWITRTGVAAIVADNFAVEAFPARPGEGPRWSTLPLHEHCLFRLGVHLGELWYLHELAEWLRANRRSRFLLTAPPLRLTGAVGSPVTPVGTV